MKDFSFITNSHPQFIESLYQDFLKNPESVDPEFKMFFQGFDFASAQAAPTNGAATTQTATSSGSTDWKAEINAYRMILGYRNKGHLIANTNPIRKRKDRGANLDLNFFGFSEADLGKSSLQVIL